jgi:predicted neutral ceramidase superfamily lipid hydrolase
MKRSIEKFYKELWILPTTKILILYESILLIIVILLIFIINSNKIIFLPVLFLVLLIEYIFTKIDKFTTLKRALGFFLFYSFGLLISFFLYSFIKNVLISTAVLVCFISLATIALDFVTPLRNILKAVYSLLVSIPLLVFYNLVIEKDTHNLLFSFTKSYAVFAITLAITELYLFLIRKTIIRKYKIDLFEHLKGFLLTWLSKNHLFYEKTLKSVVKYETSFEIPATLFETSSGKRLSLLSLPIHPGPFLSVGSSDLPTILMTKNPIHILPFHGLTTHEYDFVSNDEKNYLIDFVEKNMIRYNEVLELKISNFVETETKHFVIKGFLINHVPVIIISAKIPDIIDDLNYDTHRKAKLLCKKYGFDDLILIDAHNSYSLGLNKAIDYESEILNGIRDHLNLLKKERLESGKISFQKIPLLDIEGLENEVCKGEGYLLVFRNTTSTFCLILIDSNNIDFELRNKIVRKLLEYNIKGEICSTDTHLMTGSFTGHNGYYPFGYNKKLHEIIIRRIINTLNYANQNFEEAKISFIKIETPKFRVLGDLIKIYENAMNRFVKYGKVLPYVTFVFSVFASVLVYPLL